MAPLPSLPASAALVPANRSAGPGTSRPAGPWHGLRQRPGPTAVLALVVALAACSSSPTPGSIDGQDSAGGAGGAGRASDAGPRVTPAEERIEQAAFPSKPTPLDRTREAGHPAPAPASDVTGQAASGRDAGLRHQTEPARARLESSPQSLSQSLSQSLPQSHPQSLYRTPPQALPQPMPRPIPTLPHLQPLKQPDAERYQTLSDNPVQRVAEAPVSTFSIDVDTGSWSNIRRFLAGGSLPRRDAIRVEEMINYFPYDYPRPTDGQPFAVHTALAAAPWNPERLLLRVAIKGEDQSIDRLPPANLVFLVDVSGSMASENKLPLLQSSLKLLTATLRPQDRISIVTYASGTSAPLTAVAGNEKARIHQAIDSLSASGSTAGASGIDLAYQVASQGFIRGGINRILLATDGDFNVGVTDFNQLKQMVETRRSAGISLSALGFGTGNLNEHLMEQLADAGDGAYSYIDTLMEGQKVLVTEVSSTLATIARDVKIQVEFNPAVVAEYRLLGYENRLLAREDFNNDKVDAGDVGAGHAVTALYELTPTGKAAAIDPLRYGPRQAGARAASGVGPTGVAAASADPDRTAGEAAFVRIRYKAPGADTSRLIEVPVAAGGAASLAALDADFRFAAAIAGFGQVLRGGRHTGQWSLGDARALAASGIGDDRFGYRTEALRLIDLAGSLTASGALQPVAATGARPSAPLPR